MAAPLKSSALHMAVAFCAMGGWAVFANRAHPLPDPLIAGVVQGATSAVITLILKRMIEWLGCRLPGRVAPVLPPVLAVLGSVTVLSALHGLAGTPEILPTLAVPVTVTAIYSTAYSVSLHRERHA